MYMHKPWRNILKGVILLLFAIFFAQKYVSGGLYDYIAPRFGWLAVLAAVMFTAIGLATILGSSKPDEADDFHDHAILPKRKASKWPLIILSIPLIAEVVIPARPLGPTQIDNQGVSTNITAPTSDVKISLTIVPAQRNILDWVRAMGANPDPTALNGQQVDVIGFVYRDVRFASDQFMVARFAVSCCVADARAMGLVVKTGNASQYATGAWLRVKGTFTEGTLDKDHLPIVTPSEVIPVSQPVQPYLYP
jgi:uncharacterized repeat protein (TIGR03943 family)